MITIQLGNYPDGKINEPIHVAANITSDIAIKNIEWLCNQPVNFSVSQDQKTYNFTPSVDGLYVFTVTVWNVSGERVSAVSNVTVGSVVSLPPVPPNPTPTPTGTINISEKWTTAKTLTGHHEFYTDGKTESAAGSNRKVVFDGKGNCTISGDQVRVYCHYTNYNSVLTLDLVPNLVSSGDDCSLKLRSRHNEGGTEANRIGGEGWSLELDAWDSKRETYHNVHEGLGSGTLSQKMVNGKKYKLRFTCKDEGANKIRLTGEVDYGQGFKKEMDLVDSKAPPAFFDKTTIDKISYFWIRNNGSGSITVSNVQLQQL